MKGTIEYEPLREKIAKTGKEVRTCTLSAAPRLLRREGLIGGTDHLWGDRRVNAWEFWPRRGHDDETERMRPSVAVLIVRERKRQCDVLISGMFRADCSQPRCWTDVRPMFV